MLADPLHTAGPTRKWALRKRLFISRHKGSSVTTDGGLRCPGGMTLGPESQAAPHLRLGGWSRRSWRMDAGPLPPGARPSSQALRCWVITPSPPGPALLLAHSGPPRWFPQLGSKKGNRDPIQTWVGPRRGRWPGAPLKAYSRAPASLAAVTQGQRRGPSGSSQDVAGRVRGGAGGAPTGRKGAGGGAAKWRRAGAGPTVVRASRHAARRPAVGGAGVGGGRKQAEPASPSAAYASGNLEPGSRVFR